MDIDVIEQGAASRWKTASIGAPVTICAANLITPL
jgi:hypothetical protein